MSDTLVLRCAGLQKSYTQGGLDVNVLRGVDLELEQGECMAIVGASGSGKSTFLHLLGGLDRPDGGEVSICGMPLHTLSEKSKGELRNRNIGFVYQFHHLLSEFTALENVAIPLLMGRSSSREAMDRARDILQKVGLGDRLEHKPGEMSGGERQRAAIARALVASPRCVLADEPTGNLDEQTAAQVFDVMMELNREMGISLIMVTHNLMLAGRFPYIKRLHDGHLVDY